MRTKLADRELPDYTKGEEIFNMVSHIVGGAVGIAALVLCVIISVRHGNGWGLAGSIVFGLSMILLYTMSSVYHGLPAGKGKRVMQVLDHCSIYVLIAGTYTPVLLSAMRRIDPVGSWILFGIVWGVTVLAVTLNAIDLKQFKLFSMICYIAMGWAVIIKLPVMIRAMGWGGYGLILGGGICYTVGAVLYNLGKHRQIRYIHSVFHLFVLAGSICHVLAVLLFAL